MFLSSRAGTFCWKLLLIYLLLVGPGPWVKGVWAKWFREAATYLFKPTPSMTVAVMSAVGCKTTVDDIEQERLSVRFDPKKQPDRVLDTDMLIIRPNVKLRGNLVTVAGRMGVSGWHKCYVPLASLIALVVATPVPWRRRLFALLWGVLLVIAFVWFGLTLTFLNGITNGDAISLFQLSALPKKWLSVADYIISNAPVTSFLFPVLIWLLVTFRRGNWGEVFGPVVTRDHRGPRTDEH